MTNPSEQRRQGSGRLAAFDFAAVADDQRPDHGDEGDQCHAEHEAPDDPCPLNMDQLVGSQARRAIDVQLSGLVSELSVDAERSDSQEEIGDENEPEHTTHSTHPFISVYFNIDDKNIIYYLCLNVNIRYT